MTFKKPRRFWEISAWLWLYEDNRHFDYIRAEVVPHYKRRAQKMREKIERWIKERELV